MPSSSPERLLALFERELRDGDPRPGDPPPTGLTVARSVSAELDTLIAAYASQTRRDGATPEQMLIELKKLLGSVAPEVPPSRRNELVSRVTGRAINAYFGR